MTDVLLTDIAPSQADLIFAGGDFATGDSTGQEVENIILAFPGWWFEFPTLGCAAANYVAGPNANQLRSNIAVQLTRDGKQMQGFTSSFTTNGQLVINCNGLEIILG